MKRKFKLLTILLMFVFTTLYGQGKYHKNDLNDMINSSMLTVVDIHKEYVKEGILKQENLNKYYILKDNLPLNFNISDSFKKLNLKVVYSGEIPSKELKKGISCFSFSHIDLDSDKIKIHIGTKNMKVKVKGRILESSLGDGFSFTYQYFCDEGKWKLVDSVPKL